MKDILDFKLRNGKTRATNIIFFDSLLTITPGSVYRHVEHFMVNA